MSAQDKEPVKADSQYGPHKEEGTAGEDASYVERTLERWRMRGDGTLKKS